MELKHSKTALITGPTSGIGLDLAEELAKDRHRLILVSRRKEELEKVAVRLAQAHSIQTHVLPLDLAQPGAPSKVFSQVKELGWDVDVLVNNAGFGQYGKFSETDADGENQMLQLNVVTLTQLTKLFLPQMLAKRSGHILNVASVAGFMPGPGMAVYFATKAYVISFSEALAQEVRGTGVTVTVCCPGPTATGFQARAQMQESRMVKGAMMTSAKVAKHAYQALKSGKRSSIPGLLNKVQAAAPRFFPKRLIIAITERVVRSE